ncbi:MAG: hypothetical protein ACTHN5_05065 [Phycisphaerae bacterium]
MSPELILTLIALWIHILCAVALIGGPIFIRFAFLPAAAKILTPEQHQQLSDTLNARWKHFVYLFITLFLITGIYMFIYPTRVDGVLVTKRWADFSLKDRSIYHAIFGIKMIAAFAVFFFASALAGRTKALAPIRKNAKLFTTITIVLGVLAVLCAVIMRDLPQNPPYTPMPPADVAPLP